MQNTPSTSGQRNLFARQQLCHRHRLFYSKLEKIPVILRLLYTLFFKRNFSEPIFPGDPGSLTLTPGHVHFVLSDFEKKVY